VIHVEEDGTLILQLYVYFVTFFSLFFPCLLVFKIDIGLMVHISWQRKETAYFTGVLRAAMW
jgi:hypothetical protein